MKTTRLSFASAPLLALILFPATLPRAEGQAPEEGSLRMGC